MNTKEYLFVPQFTISEGIKNWDGIKMACDSVFVNDDPCIDHLRFPGLVVSSINNYHYYVQEFLSSILSAPNIIQPRGNLTKKSKYAFIGIRPGPGSPKYEAGTAWLFGPSSRMLHKLLTGLGIYPYFTNVYKAHTSHVSPEVEREYSINLFIREILTIDEMCDNISLIFMGNYDEYDEIISKLDGKFDCSKIWHPSYLIRAFTEEKFNKWRNQLSGSNNFRR